MKTEAGQLSGLDPLLSINELAEYLGVPIKTIYDWRHTGRGPVGIRMGGNGWRAGGVGLATPTSREDTGAPPALDPYSASSV